MYGDSEKNQGAWILEPKGKLVVKDAPMPYAGHGEVVIQNFAFAINPVECTTLFLKTRFMIVKVYVTDTFPHP